MRRWHVLIIEDQDLGCPSEHWIQRLQKYDPSSGDKYLSTLFEQELELNGYSLLTAETEDGYPIPGEDNIGGTVIARNKLRSRLLGSQNRAPIVDVERDFFEAWSMIEKLGSRPLDFVFLDVKLDQITIDDEKIVGIIDKFISDANITDNEVIGKLRGNPTEFLRRGGLYLFSKLMRKRNEWLSHFPEIVVYTKSATIRTEFCSLQYAFPGIFSIGNKSDSRVGDTITPLIRSRSVHYMKMGEVSVSSISESVDKVRKILSAGPQGKGSMKTALMEEIGNGWLFSTFFILQIADLINWRNNLGRAQEALTEIEEILSEADFAFCLKRFFYDTIVRIFTHPLTLIPLVNPPFWLVGNSGKYNIKGLQGFGPEVIGELNKCWESLPKKVREILDFCLKELMLRGLSEDGREQLAQSQLMQQGQSILCLSEWINEKDGFDEFPSVCELFSEIPVDSDEFDAELKELIKNNGHMLIASLLQHVYTLVRGKPRDFGQQLVKTLEKMENGLKLSISAEPLPGMPDSDYQQKPPRQDDNGMRICSKENRPSPIVFLPPTLGEGLGWPLDELVIAVVETASEFHANEEPLKVNLAIRSDIDSGTTSVSLHFPDVAWLGLEDAKHRVEGSGGLVSAIENVRGWVRDLAIESGEFIYKPLSKNRPERNRSGSTPKFVQGTNYVFTISCAFK